MKRILTILMLCVTMVGFAAPKKLDLAEKKKLNTFFSNFSEANLEGFKQGALSDEAMLNFALRHVYINQFKSLKRSKDKNSVIVPAEQLNAATVKYFGKKVQNHKEQSYTILCADGDVSYFSQLNSLEDLGNLIFKAEGTIYSFGPGYGTQNVHGTPEAWTKAGEKVDVSGKFTALIKAVSERYILVEYALADSETSDEPNTDAKPETTHEATSGVVRRRN